MSWFRWLSVTKVIGPPGLVVALSLISFASSASAAAPCATQPSSGGQWPMYGHDVSNTRTQPEASGLGPAAVSKLAPAWVFSTSSTGDSSGARGGA